MGSHALSIMTAQTLKTITNLKKKEKKLKLKFSKCSEFKKKNYNAKLYDSLVLYCVLYNFSLRNAKLLEYFRKFWISKMKKKWKK